MKTAIRYLSAPACHVWAWSSAVRTALVVSTLLLLSSRLHSFSNEWYYKNPSYRSKLYNVEYFGAREDIYIVPAEIDLKIRNYIEREMGEFVLSRYKFSKGAFLNPERLERMGFKDVKYKYQLEYCLSLPELGIDCFLLPFLVDTRDSITYFPEVPKDYKNLMAADQVAGQAQRYIKSRYSPEPDFFKVSVTLEYSGGSYVYVVIGPGREKGVNRVLMMDAKNGRILADKASKDLYKSGVLWRSLDFTVNEKSDR